MTSSGSWSLRKPSDLALSTWPDEDAAVAFDGIRGRTHLIDIIACEVLEALQQQDLTTAELTAHLSAAVEPGDRPRLQAHLEGVMLRLQEAELVSSAAPP